jgi:EAL domain-containing protein (putative c-di-GMP-specific phosphodiesterase class I)
VPSQRNNDEDLVADLQGGIDRGEFRLEYQPIVRLGGGVVAGAEALVRWRHPKRGTIPPAEFLPLAESSGLIDQIGNYVLDEACRAAAGWPRTSDKPGLRQRQRRAVTAAPEGHGRGRAEHARQCRP